MSSFVTPAIPVSQTVAIQFNVLGAGGGGTALIGLMLDYGNPNSYRVPIGTVISFADAADVAAYFGAASLQAAEGSVYFAGPNNSTITPAAMLAAQFPYVAVSGWLGGGNIGGLTLTQLQAINAALTLTIDAGEPITETVNLSAATSFSNAAEIITNTMGIKGVETASVTASLGGTFGTCTTTGEVLTLGSVTHGYLSVGDTVTATDGTNTLNTTIVAQLTGTPGGSAGATFSITAGATPGNLGSSTVTSASTILHVTVVGSGTLSVANVVSGTGITSGTYIESLVSGTTGGIGFYNLSGSQQTAAGGTSETVLAYSPAVIFDSTSQGFQIFSGTTGATSSVAFATGAAATSLLLTQATGAIVSPGAAAAGDTGATTFMDALTGITQNWLSFWPDWEPSDTLKEGFATWTNTGNGNPLTFRFIMPDSNVVNTNNSGPSAPVYLVNGNSDTPNPSAGLNGTVMVHTSSAIDPTQLLAAFVASWPACLNFNQQNGAQTADFKSQNGLPPQVLSGSIAAYLGGSPLSPTLNQGYGLNFYGNNTLPNAQFTYYARGFISGKFTWDDDYCFQVWLRNQFQLAYMNLLTSVGRIPYNAADDAMIYGSIVGPAAVAGQAPTGPINQAVFFGMIQPGVSLSASQIVAVNNAAGLNIATQLFNQGWFLQVLPANAATRAARASPPINFWYQTGESVQAINMAATEVQ